jgi:hypothetical protein
VWTLELDHQSSMGPGVGPAVGPGKGPGVGPTVEPGVGPRVGPAVGQVCVVVLRVGPAMEPGAGPGAGLYVTRFNEHGKSHCSPSDVTALHRMSYVLTKASPVGMSSALTKAFPVGLDSADTGATWVSRCMFPSTGSPTMKRLDVPCWLLFGLIATGYPGNPCTCWRWTHVDPTMRYPSTRRSPCSTHKPLRPIPCTRPLERSISTTGSGSPFSHFNASSILLAS